MGDCLLVVGNKQTLHIIPQGPGKKKREREILPPEGIPPEFKSDYEVASIHLMPDNRTLYFKALFTITSGIYGMDIETARVRKISYGDGRTIRFSTTSQYLFDMSWEHPGDGYLHIGAVTAATADLLKAGNFVDSSTGTPSPAFAALGPWCAFTMDMVRTPGSDEVLSSIELLFLPDSHVVRLITGPQDQVGRLSFSWFRQMLIVDMKAPEGRAISVFDPRSFLSSGR
jgi:hypothetical protein